MHVLYFSCVELEKGHEDRTRDLFLVGIVVFISEGTDASCISISTRHSPTQQSPKHVEREKERERLREREMVGVHIK